MTNGNWTIERLNEVVNIAAEESATLEFKQSASLQRSESSKNELAKDISSFANAGGGTIIYGIVEKDRKATGLDQGSDPKQITGEWLDQVVGQRIQPRIRGLRIYSVPTGTGHIYYVVEIPETNSGPHQASDKKYYRRRNFVAEPMDDFEIRDVFRRTNAPDLDMQLLVNNGTKASRPTNGCVELTAQVINLGSAPADHVLIRILISEGIKIARVGGFAPGRVTRVEMVFDDTGPRIVNMIEIHRTPKSDFPIYDSLPVRVDLGVLDINTEIAGGEFLLGYEVRAPNMQPRSAVNRLISMQNLVFEVKKTTDRVLEIRQNSDV